MRPLVEQTLKYWSEVIVRSDMVNMQVASDAESITPDALIDGVIPAAKAQHIIYNIQKNKTSKSLETDLKLDHASILICIRPLKNHSSKEKHALLYVPATLYEDGAFALPTSQYDLPWIGRRFLEPAESENGIIIGTLKNFDDAIRNFNFNPSLSWSHYLSEAFNLFEDVSGYALGNFNVTPNHINEDKNIIVIQPYERVAGAGKRIKSVYSYLIKNDFRAPVLEKLIMSDRTPEEASPPYFTKNQIIHTGQMGNDFGLNESQRQAVLSTLGAKDHSIIAVNGPPGTGKTTLLKSIIASMWVNAALKGGDTMPPLILGASTNNQAVTNILDSFDELSEDIEIISQRWLPSPINQYGLYFPARSKEASAKSYQFVSASRTDKKTDPCKGWPALIERKDFISKAEEFYLEQSMHYFNLSVVPTIHSTLSKIHLLLSQTYNNYKIALNSSISLSPEESEAIDKSYRYDLFNIAARYWEGRWLLEIKQALKNNEFLSDQTSQGIYKRLQRWAMLAPCFISTLHNAPAAFSYYVPNDDKERYPLLDKIDLLIIDEAGQITPETGAATFSLAKKALVVGDIYQIEPITALSEDQDNVEAKRFGLDFEILTRKKLNSSGSSIMAMANQSTAVTSRNSLESGLTLNEHRRCKNILIEYCNTLVYQGKLQAKAKDGDKANGITPIWGYAHTVNIPRSVGGSFVNYREAEIIAEWISDHKDSLLATDRYKDKALSDIIAVITPYAAQRNTLEKALRRHLGFNDVKNMTIGTVHALQGAEKPIILFSPTVTYKDNVTPFFDHKPNMLNVAVSRAKDSFLVFGDMRLFNEQDTTRPSGLLGAFLKAEPDNEITDIDVLEFKDHPKLKAENRFTTPEEHEDLLVHALENAKFRVLIASPFLSIKRIDQRLEDALYSAVNRHIKVAIVYNEDLNKQFGVPKEHFLAAKKKLEDCGCQVKHHSRFHNKTLAVDNTDLIDGSYNWLSAVLDRQSPHHNKEVSQRYIGEHLADVIEHEWQEYGLS